MIMKYDLEADLIAVEFRGYQDSGEWYGERFNERRHVMRDRKSGEVISVELLFVGKGIEYEGLPKADRIRALLSNLRQFAPAA